MGKFFDNEWAMRVEKIALHWQNSHFQDCKGEKHGWE
jgi:hypothetical protein